MSGHLLVVSVGPVQGFIAAARRTRDLWMGSHLLSEISKSVARELAEAGCRLIYPGVCEDGSELKASENVRAFSISNIVLVEIPGEAHGDGGGSIEGFVKRAKEAAKRKWLEFANSALQRMGEYNVKRPIWDAQVDDFLELYCASVPFRKDETPEANNWQTARRRLMRLLAGRKALRDFKPPRGIPKNPKSSLDGARESVLTKNGRAVCRDLRLARGEQLSAIGVVKRLYSSQSFPSVSRVALDPWIRAINAQGGQGKDLLQDLLQVSKGRAFSSGTGEYYGDFPLDGEFLYRSRLDGLLAEVKNVSNGGRDEELQALESIRAKLKKLVKIWGEPDPYLAIIVADGDRMGEFLSSLKTVEENVAFSRTLAEFSTRARDLVEQENGVMIYSGGDDVLALTPLDKCISTAIKLRKLFEEKLRQYSYPDGGTLTFSIGIAIGHFLDPLEDLLTHGREAEAEAKRPDRNGLAIHLHTRGGAPVKLRGQWKLKIASSIEKWVELLSTGAVSDRFANEIRELTLIHSDWTLPTAEKKRSIEISLRRVLSKKRERGGASPVKHPIIEEVVRHLTNDLNGDLELFGLEFLIARKLAGARPKLKSGDSTQRGGTV
ncbi:MAG: type III-B CRISPR-associated protein Cas10/Cmr2 [Promethearchaeota archaeon]